MMKCRVDITFRTLVKILTNPSKGLSTYFGARFGLSYGTLLIIKCYNDHSGIALLTNICRALPLTLWNSAIKIDRDSLIMFYCSSQQVHTSLIFDALTFMGQTALTTCSIQGIVTSYSDLFIALHNYDVDTSTLFNKGSQISADNF